MIWPTQYSTPCSSLNENVYVSRNFFSPFSFSSKANQYRLGPRHRRTCYSALLNIYKVKSHKRILSLFSVCVYTHFLAR